MKIKVRAWNENTKVMVDLQKITPLALADGMSTQLSLQGGSGLFIPFLKSMKLMQFTGLLDKNGKEIYEGDVVKLGRLPTEEEPEDDENIAEVIFSKGQFWCTHYGFPVHSWACNDKCFIEVVGNIYENPELLKEAP
ncbi:MAG: hypothetical protein KAR40_09735 [Candidatus Sabulitectum sp.]|nr:hypothetical protein [Candidatus Sabulitectum sp.]